MINKLTDKTDGQKAIYVINMYLNYKKKRAELGLMTTRKYSKRLINTINGMFSLKKKILYL